MMRFTSRDPFKGAFSDPQTLHVYLYCLNDPIDNIDPLGELALNVMNTLMAGAEMHAAAINTTAVGAMYQNDTIMMLGIAMEQLVAPAMAMNMHHALPKFPGGNQNGILVALEKGLHTGKGGLHSLLRERLAERWGKGCQNWSTGHWKTFLDEGRNRLQAWDDLMRVTAEIDVERGDAELSKALYEQILKQWNEFF